MKLFVLRSEFVDELYLQTESKERIQAYRAPGSIPIENKFLLESPIETAGDPPELVVTPGPNRAVDDVENAIKLHMWLKPMTAREARDNRLWTWLAHGPYAEYCRKRWQIPQDETKARNSIRDHWILRGNGRGAVVRHSIARLFWAARATYQPHAVCSEYSADSNDDYRLTRVLLGNQNTNLQLRDRSIGSNSAILLAALKALSEFHGPMDDAVAWLGKELSIAGRFRSLDSLSLAKLLGFCSDTLAAFQKYQKTPSTDSKDALLAPKPQHKKKKKKKKNKKK